MIADRRTVGLTGAVSIGIGGMVGGGIFAVLGEAVTIAHGATAVAFLMAGMVALLTSYAYAKLSVKYQTRGGTVVFVDNAFGRELFSGSVNLILWLSYLVTIALYAVAFGSYAQTFFRGNESPVLRHILISTAILLPAAINLLNASIVSKSEAIVVIIKLILLAVIIATGASFIDNERLAPSGWGTPVSIFAAGMVIFVAYEGFELIANSAEEIRNPARNLPRALYGSVLLVIVLYVLIALVTVGTVPESQLVRAKDYALAVAARPALGETGFTIVAVAALLATFSAINATIYGNARLGYILAKDGELPGELDRKAWNEPVGGVLVTAALSLLMANLIDLAAIAIIGSASFLLVFAVANASAVRLAKEIGGLRGVYVIAFLACLAALIVLLTETCKSNPRAVWVFSSFIATAVVFELTYGRLARDGFLRKSNSDGDSGSHQPPV
jgi:amino acid transporter